MLLHRSSLISASVLITSLLSHASAIAQTTSVPASTTSAIFVHNTSGIAISADDVLAELQNATPSDRQSIMARPDILRQIAQNLLVRRVLATEAERDGLGKEPLIASAIAIGRDRVLSDARLVRLDAQNSPSEAALEAYALNVYKASGNRFEKPAQTHARHILLKNENAESLKLAQELLAKLRAGDSFEELAKAHSIDTSSAVRGGDLGFFGPGRMVRPFEDAVNALTKPGELSEPVETQFGYHIIRLESRKEKGIQPFEEVRKQLVHEARTALLTDSRIQKVQTMSKDFAFEQDAIDKFVNSQKR